MKKVKAMRGNPDDDGGGTILNLGAVSRDDAFLTALSRGENPSGGGDWVAADLLALRDRVERPMPPAPEVAGVEAAAPAPAKTRRGPGPLASGLIGAAAATVIVAGSGAALYSATPGSPLWGASTAVFGDRSAAVELASTLDQFEVAQRNGDSEGVRTLLGQARALVGAIAPATPAPDPAPAERGEGPATVTVTVEATPGGQAPRGEAAALAAPAPAAPSAPATQTVTVTVTVTEPAGQGASTSSPASDAETTVAAEPTAAPSRTAAPSEAKREPKP